MQMLLRGATVARMWVLSTYCFGLLAQDSSMASKILSNAGVTLDRARMALSSDAKGSLVVNAGRRA